MLSSTVPIVRPIVNITIAVPLINKHELQYYNDIDVDVDDTRPPSSVLSEVFPTCMYVRGKQLQKERATTDRRCVGVDKRSQTVDDNILSLSLICLRLMHAIRNIRFKI